MKVCKVLTIYYYYYYYIRFYHAFEVYTICWCSKLILMPAALVNVKHRKFGVECYACKCVCAKLTLYSFDIMNIFAKFFLFLK